MTMYDVEVWNTVSWGLLDTKKASPNWQLQNNCSVKNFKCTNYFIYPTQGSQCHNLLKSILFYYIGILVIFKMKRAKNLPNTCLHYNGTLANIWSIDKQTKLLHKRKNIFYVNIQQLLYKFTLLTVSKE